MSVQIATLVVAGLAVVASIGGTIYNANKANKSEHGVWQRDLRVRIYSDCTTSCERIIRLLTVYSANIHNRTRSEVSKNDYVLEHIAEYRALRTDLIERINDVQTFGSKQVVSSSLPLGEGLLLAADTIIGIDPVSIDDTKGLLKNVQGLLNSFRFAIRTSLRIGDD